MNDPDRKRKEWIEEWQLECFDAIKGRIDLERKEAKMSAIRPNGEFKFPKLTSELSPNFLGQVALGNATQYRIAIMNVNGSVFIGIEGRGAYQFTHYVHWAYAKEKLGILEGDAKNVADFINDQLGAPDYPRQGVYSLMSCQEWSDQ